VGWFKDNVVFLWQIVKEVAYTFYHALATEKHPTIQSGDGGFSRYRQLVTHSIDSIVYRPSGGVETLLRNLAYAFIQAVFYL